MPFEETGKWVYNKGKKVDRVVDKSLDGAGSIADGVAGLLAGDTKILMYLGIGVVGVGVAWHLIPKLIDKVV
jgi:hypothetical protein